MIWDDSVAPETTIDFEVPVLQTGQALKWFAGAMGGFTSLYLFCSWVDPQSEQVWFIPAYITVNCYYYIG